MDTWQAGTGSQCDMPQLPRRDPIGFVHGVREAVDFRRLAALSPEVTTTLDTP